jgi:hypothetical protein
MPVSLVQVSPPSSRFHSWWTTLVCRRLGVLLAEEFGRYANLGQENISVATLVSPDIWAGTPVRAGANA